MWFIAGKIHTLKQIHIGKNKEYDCGTKQECKTMVAESEVHHRVPSWLLIKWCTHKGFNIAILCTKVKNLLQNSFNVTAKINLSNNNKPVHRQIFQCYRLRSILSIYLSTLQSYLISQSCGAESIFIESSRNCIRILPVVIQRGQMLPLKIIFSFMSLYLQLPLILPVKHQWLSCMIKKVFITKVGYWLHASVVEHPSWIIMMWSGRVSVVKGDCEALSSGLTQHTPSWYTFNRLCAQFFRGNIHWCHSSTLIWHR